MKQCEENQRGIGPVVNLPSRDVGFDTVGRDFFSNGDVFNLVWVPSLGDVGPSDLNFQIFKRKKNM